MKVSLAAVVLCSLLLTVFAQLTRGKQEYTCTTTWWEDGYLYTERETPNPKNRRCIVLKVWKKVLYREITNDQPCDDLIECHLYAYDVTVQLQRDNLKFELIKYPEDVTTLEEVDDKTLKWSIDEKYTTDEFNGTYELVVCFSGNNSLGKVSTLKLIKPAVNMGISGTAPCQEGD